MFKTITVFRLNDHKTRVCLSATSLTLALCNKVKEHLNKQRADATKDDPEEICDCPERDRFDRADPYHWEQWGRSSMQAALMYLNRAIAQPTTF